jgi:tetratricopeptide (TPR) repeat protein
MSLRNRLASAVIILLLSSSLCSSQTADDQQQQIGAHMQKAQSFLREKKPDLAIPEFEAVVALDPKNVDAQANLGVLLLFRGDYVKAIPPLRAALTMQPDLTRIQALLGIAEKRTGDSADALKDLEASFPLLLDQKMEQKFKTQAGMELIEIYTASGDQDKAAIIISQLRRADPENKEVLYAAYRIYADLSGESMLTLSLLAPDSAQMHQIMAHEETRQGNTNGAIAQYRKAIAINPRLPGIHFELAELLNSSQDPKVREEAEQQYMVALEANPLDSKTERRLGEIYTRKGDLKQAYAHYSKAVSLQPSDAEANLGLAVTLMSMNQTSQALPVLERAVQLDPTNASAHYRLGTLYRQQGRMEDSKREVDQYKKYKDMKEKLRAVYKEMQIQPDEIRESEKDDK